MGFFAMMFGAKKEKRAMAEVARQVLTIIGSGAREGAITINMLNFPGAGSPEFIAGQVIAYLESGGVTIHGVDRPSGTHLLTFQVSMGDGYKGGEPFGSDYQALISPKAS
jgi:hypothetical protein